MSDNENAEFELATLLRGSFLTGLYDFGKAAFWTFLLRVKGVKFGVFILLCNLG